MNESEGRRPRNRFGSGCFRSVRPGEGGARAALAEMKGGKTEEPAVKDDARGGGGGGAAGWLCR